MPPGQRSAAGEGLCPSPEYISIFELRKIEQSEIRGREEYISIFELRKIEQSEIRGREEYISILRRMSESSESRIREECVSIPRRPPDVAAGSKKCRTSNPLIKPEKK